MFFGSVEQRGEERFGRRLGLGNATAAALAARGAHVFGLNVDVSRAPELEGVTYLKADVKNEADITRAQCHPAWAGR